MKMKFDFGYDLSRPVAVNDTVILMVHNKGGFTAKIEPGKTIKICKDTLKLDMLIGCSYGDMFLKDNADWVKIRRNDPQYQQYRNRIREEALEESIEAPPDNRNIHDDNTAQKLSYDEIQRLKKDKNAQEVIEMIVDNSETFAKKNKMAQEKYIMRKEARHVKLFYVRPCDLYNVCDCYFNSFPHKIGYLNFANLGMMLYLADIRHGYKVIVLDHALGLITAAASQRLAGSGQIYRLVCKGVSDKIVHELGIRYFDNIVSIDMDRYIPDGTSDNNASHTPTVNLLTSASADANTNPSEHGLQCEGAGPPGDGRETAPSDLVDDSDGSRKRALEADDNPMTEDPRGSSAQCHRDSDADPKKHKKTAVPGIYPLHSPSIEEVSGCQVVIGNVAFNKCDKLNSVVSAYTMKLKAAADAYLELGGRIVVFGQQYQPMAELQAKLTLSDEYVNVKFDEVFIREYQVGIPSGEVTARRCCPCEPAP
ncbi:eukaryotic initiation factor 3, gamma subunit protein [Babesia caballi]|uniref:tRNA (adenine(58)-N(1))-methyltransferase non-catalytic subunit TRM6 n=1 Tax=Babesia caballi TaxID=5871 RepID=A0AAV4LS95_BABCB|nr:eukaryotic initiation factor 3, gamma subunit protein [Babesia caballi]